MCRRLVKWIPKRSSQHSRLSNLATALMIGTPSFSWKGTGHTWICMPESLRRIIHQACARSHFLSAAAGRYWIPVAFKSLKQSFEKKTNWLQIEHVWGILSFEHFWLSASPLLVAGTDSTCKMLHQTGLELARSCQDSLQSSSLADNVMSSEMRLVQTKSTCCVSVSTL